MRRIIRIALPAVPLVVALLAARTAAAECDVFESSFSCWETATEMPFCDTYPERDVCTRIDSDIYVSEECAGDTITNCNSPTSCLCQDDEYGVPYPWEILKKVYWPKDGEPIVRVLPHLFRVGEKAAYNGKRYRVRQEHHAALGWEPPSAFALWERVDAGKDWATQVIYKRGTKVKFKGKWWKALQTHQAVNGYEPTKAKSLWKRA